jgi:hypothetical protein
MIRPSFEVWSSEVRHNWGAARLLARLAGVRLGRKPPAECPLYDWFRAGLSPSAAVSRALATPAPRTQER